MISDDEIKAFMKCRGDVLKPDVSIQTQADYDQLSWEMMPDLAREVLRLRSLPCDSDLANRWLNENAPQHVLDSLWAWRRIADEALKVAQAAKGSDETKR